MKPLHMSLALAWVMAAASLTAAQTPYPPNLGAGPRPNFRPPTTSPYLNLLRGGNIAANYYEGVIPEVRQRVLNYQFQSAIQTLDTRTLQPTLPADETQELLPGIRTLPSTGHTATFNNHGSYYNFGNRGGANPLIVTPSGPTSTRQQQPTPPPPPAKPQPPAKPK